MTVLAVRFLVSRLASSGPGRRSGGSGKRGRVTHHRDQAGRFVGPRPSRRLVGLSRSGRRGSTTYVGKSHSHLVEMLVVAEHRLGRLEAEERGQTWTDPEAEPLPNMGGVDSLREEVKKRRTAAVEAAVVYFASRRQAPTGEEFHLRVLKELDGTMSPRALYREPYVAIWNPSLSRSLGPALRAPSAKDRAKMPRRTLVSQIMRVERLCEAALARLRIALVEASERDDWLPCERR